MIDYVRQVFICESVRETIKRALAQSNDISVRLKVNNITATDGILRTVSLHPNINTEETLLDFITEHILSSLRLTTAQREQLLLNS
jgi:hypothetical protein